MAQMTKLFKTMPGLTDRARNVVLKFWDHFRMSNIIVSYMRLMDPLATQILVARPAYRPVYLKFAQ